MENLVMDIFSTFITFRKLLIKITKVLGSLFKTRILYKVLCHLV